MSVRIIIGDVRDKLAELPDESVHCCVTSPPYFGLRDYGVVGQIGLEASPEAFVAELVAVFRDVRRVLRDDGTLWLNLGDSYASASGQKTITPQTAYLTGRAGGDAFAPAKKTLGYAAKQAGFKEYGAAKPKDLLGIPWRVAMALQADGWWLRSDIIWHKPNPMPESVTDRPTSAHEHIFLLAKSERYYFDAESVRVPFADDRMGSSGTKSLRYSELSGRNGDAGLGRPPKAVQQKLDKQRGHSRRHAGFNDRWDQMERDEQIAGGANIRNVWTIATQPYSEAHFATFPPALIEPCIKAGCPVGGTVLDPFGGAGTTGLVADRLGRSAILTELNPEYAEIARKRISGDAGMFAKVDAA